MNDNGSSRSEDAASAAKTLRKRRKIAPARKDDDDITVNDSNLVDEIIHGTIDSLKKLQRSKLEPLSLDLPTPAAAVPQKGSRTIPNITSGSDDNDNKISDDISSINEIENNKSISVAMNARIIELKDELTWIHDIKDKLIRAFEEKIIQPKLDELSSCFDSFSPLLSLGHIPLLHILSFLDEEELMICEKASCAMGNVANCTSTVNNLWLQHHRRRIKNNQMINDKNDGSTLQTTLMIHNSLSHSNHVQYRYKPETFAFGRRTSDFESSTASSTDALLPS